MTVKAGTDELVALVKDNKNRYYGYINTKGQWVIAPNYLAGTQFSNGLAAVLARGGDSHWQIIDKSGAVKVDCTKDIDFVSGSRFSGGLMMISSEGFTKFGFANTEGRIVVQPIYNQALGFSEGLAAVCSDKGWGFIDTTGNEVIPCKYNVAHSFSGGRAYVKYTPPDGIFKNGDAFIDQTGKIVFEDIGVGNEKTGFEQFMSDFQSGVALCLSMNGRETGRGLALLNDAGNIVWYDKDQKYSLPSTYKWNGENLFYVQVSDTDGFIDTSGNLVCTVPEGFRLTGEVSGFCGGMCVVKDADSRLFGYMDKSGTVAIPAVYQDAKAFVNGYASVSKDWSAYTYIDKTGKTAVSGDFVCVGEPFTK